MQSLTMSKQSHITLDRPFSFNLDLAKILVNIFLLNMALF